MIVRQRNVAQCLEGSFLPCALRAIVLRCAGQKCHVDLCRSLHGTGPLLTCAHIPTLHAQCPAGCHMHQDTMSQHKCCNWEMSCNTKTFFLCRNHSVILVMHAGHIGKHASIRYYTHRYVHMTSEVKL